MVKLSLFSALWSSFPCEHGVYHFLASLRSWSSRASLKLRLLGYSNRPLRANDGGAKLLAAAARQELSSRVLYLHHLAAKWPFFALSSPTTHILAWLKYDNLDFTFFFTFFFLDSSLTNQAWNHSKIYSLHTSTQCWNSLILLYMRWIDFEDVWIFHTKSTKCKSAIWASFGLKIQMRQFWGIFNSCDLIIFLVQWEKHHFSYLVR